MPDEQEEQEGAQDVADALIRPVWATPEPSECRLKVLQACQLIAEYKERHRTTLPALKDLLLLLQALLPPNLLPRSVYLYRKVSEAVLQQAFGGSGFRRLHMCSNLECTHLYKDEEEALRQCPDCDRPRYRTLENGKEQAMRQLRFMGVERGVRVLLMSKKVCRGLHNFDLAEMVDSTYSLFSSKLSEHLCTHFIPDYALLPADRQRIAKLRFFDTGQACTEPEWQQYREEVAAGTRQRTKLLVVEGGCDGFQPFKRRVWSTWMFGYRLTCVNWLVGASGQYEIVTAISEGSSEGKAAHVVAALDAQHLIELCPPSAGERARGLHGVPLQPSHW